MSPYHDQKQHVPSPGRVCSWSCMVKQSMEFIQLEAFFPSTKLIFVLDQIPDSALCGLRSAVPSEMKGEVERTEPLFSVMVYHCVGRNWLWSCTLFAICSLEGFHDLIVETLKIYVRFLPRVAHQFCWIPSMCCSMKLIRELLARAIVSQHRVGVAPSKNILTERFAAHNSQKETPPWMPCIRLSSTGQEQSPGVGNVGFLYLGHWRLMQGERRQSLAAVRTSSWLPVFVAIMWKMWPWEICTWWYVCALEMLDLVSMMCVILCLRSLCVCMMCENGPPCDKHWIYS